MLYLRDLTQDEFKILEKNSRNVPFLVQNAELFYALANNISMQHKHQNKSNIGYTLP